MAKTVPVTTSGRSNITGTSSRDGEEIGGVGSRYTGTLNQRTNKSFGKTGNDGADLGRSSVGPGMPGSASMGARKTGRVG